MTRFGSLIRVRSLVDRGVNRQKCLASRCDHGMWALESVSVQENGRRVGPLGFVKVQIVFAPFEANADEAVSEDEVPAPVWRNHERASICR
jgi:hypothetical protein